MFTVYIQQRIIMDDEIIENLDENQIMDLYNDIIEGSDLIADKGCPGSGHYYVCQNGREWSAISMCNGSRAVSYTLGGPTGRTCK